MMRFDIVLVELERLLRGRNRVGHPILSRVETRHLGQDLSRIGIKFARALERRQRCGIVALRLGTARHQELVERLGLGIVGKSGSGLSQRR